jgi:two-component system, NtrC family, sensor histidine kinase GlrK
VRRSIRGKFLVGFAVVIGLMILGNAYVLREFYLVSRTATGALTADARVVDLANLSHAALSDEERLMQMYQRSGDTSYLRLADESGLRFTATLDSMSALVQERPLLSRPLREIERSHSWLHRQSTDSTRTVSNGAPDLRTPAEATVYIHRTLDQVIAYARNSITVSLVELGQSTRRSITVALLLTISTFLAAAGLAILITQTITRPLETLTRGTEQVARGSFEHIQVTSSDETARLAAAFNTMSDRLSAMNAYRAEMMQHISHELRSPVQLMLSSLFLLTERSAKPLDETQRRLLGTIRENIERVTAFADAFLDLAKIEAGMMEYKLAILDVTALLRKTVEDATILARSRNISVRFHADSSEAIMADVEKCTHVLSNLLSNAVKYTPDGGAVNVSVHPAVSSVRIEVADTGVGISQEDLPKIFTKFFRASNAVKGKTRGTGLGLALVKALVEGHGGTVDVRSELGKGSTFSVEFPRIPPDGDRS